jgi:hypothetical protein
MTLLPSIHRCLDSSDAFGMTAPDNQPGPVPLEGSPVGDFDELFLLKGRLRKILHRMNNDLTAVALSVDTALISCSEETVGEAHEKRLKVVQELVSSLSNDLREMTRLCGKDSVEK